MPRLLARSAIAAAILATFNVQAAPPLADHGTIVVTATRFADSALPVAAPVSIISAEEIRQSPALGMPEILKAQAGLEVRSLYGNMGIDSVVDIRGFGDTGGSNAVTLLDGQRINSIGMDAVSWSAIPLESVQRIEILRGAGTVLYGDRATGGVINIITDKSGQPRASATATLGSNNYQSLGAQVAGGGEHGYFNLFAHYAETDGWRQNSQARQQAITGRSALTLAAGEAFVDFSLYEDKSGMPSSLLSAAYRSDPRQARTPADSQQRDGYRVRPGLKLKLSAHLALEAELAADHEKYDANNVSFASTYRRERDTLSLTPRLRWNHGLAGLNSETVLGLDYYDGKVAATSASAFGVIPQTARQTSTAYYLQNTTTFDRQWSMTVGARRQRVDQRVVQQTYNADYGFGPFPVPGLSDGAVRHRNAYDLALNYQAGAWRIYGKTGTMFRFANTDELFGYDPFTGNPVFAGDIKPQHGRVHEIGGDLELGPIKARASLFRLDLNDEIGYDGAAFANVNFDRSRRQGLETELDWRLSEHLKTRISYSLTDARFREGPYADKEIPMVARDKLALQLTWQAGSDASYSAIATHQGDRRYSGDYANTLGHLAGYTTLDVQGSWRFKPWTLTAKLLNVFDRRYAPYAGYSTFRSDYYYFPADGRSLFVSARYDFK